MCAASALWKNGGLDRDTVWHHRSGGSRDQRGIGDWQSVHGKGYLLGTNLGRAIVSNGELRRTCATVLQPSELRFGVVLAVGRGTAVLDGGQRSPTGRGRFGGFCSPFLQWEIP